MPAWPGRFPAFRIMKTLRPLPAVICLLTLTAPALRAQSILNPSFEANTFTFFPGYANGNGPITGWTISGGFGVGLNPAGGSPFANNGATPQGNNVAFLQNAGNNTLTTLSTTITGLSRNLVYVVRFRVNQRSGYPAPTAAWSLNGDPYAPISAGPAVGGANAYYYVSGTFKAGGTEAALVIGNQSATDATLLVDDFSIAPAPPATSGWAVSPWTDDASTGISLQTRAAWRFGSAVSPDLNGKTVTGVDGPNPAVAGQFTISGVPNVLTGVTNSLTAITGSDIAELAKNFIWGGDPATITLQSLIPGHTYVCSFLSVGWEAAGGRPILFASGGVQRVVDQDQFGDNNGLRVDHIFVADAATRVITLTPQIPGTTFHLYALALREPILVSNTADAGTGSLRWALATAATQDGPDFIAFDPALSGQTITLLTEIAVTDQGEVTLDASTLPGGLTLGISGGHGHFNFATGTRTALRGLSLVKGGGAASGGGAILNRGTLTLTDCTLDRNGSSNGLGSTFGGAILNYGYLALADCILSGNSAGGSSGGAIANLLSLTLTRCTLTGNTSDGGGAIYSDSGIPTLTDCLFSGNSSGNSGGAIFTQGTGNFTRCTFSGNSSSDRGGAIYHFFGPLILTDCTLSGNTSQSYGGAIAANTINGSDGTTTLTHCTLSGNSALQGGGGIYHSNNLAALTLTNCIVAGNTAPFGADVNFRGNFIRQGNNLIQSVFNSGAGTDSGPAALTADPRLAPLANYGGLTPTMALRPGSPARNTAVASTATADQRGFPLVGLPDIGAYEAGTLTNCAAILAETLPSTVPAALVGPAGDYDGDGCTNEQEWNAGTDHTNRASCFRILSAVRSGGNVTITFPTVPGRSYTLWRSDVLTGPWTNTGLPPVAGNGSNQSFLLPAPVAGVPKRFYRVQSMP